MCSSKGCIKLMARFLQIQQRDTNGFWKNIRVSGITTSEDEVIIVAPRFRILIDGKEVYKE